ncbi:SGNH/GDSL hydrolase family protein [Salinibacter ruber]|uniref:SGNH/GDSL hydrolase family protein n=1 Tax=Salinibacter ruber TaxID=146919 RepID=UPI0013C35FC8|nr:SGNH/GDSL hydrolase family protein [Salinibacter ruber]
MKHSLVFVEAPVGLVEPQKWTGRWARPEWPTLLSSNLSVAEIVSLWWRADDPVWNKAVISAASFSDLVRYGPVIRNKVHSWMSSLIQVHSEAPDGNIESLPEGAGIRTDSAGVALAREKIIPSMRKWAHVDYERSSLQWKESVLASLVETVRAHGGEVVLYTMPVSTPSKSVIEKSQMLRAERDRLKDWAETRGIPFLNVDFPYSNEDFPDLAHLRSSEALAFSRRLAREYKTHVKRSSITRTVNHKTGGR